MKQSMRGVLTAISSVMMFLPWTIFIVRENAWALESPAAEIVIGSYAAYMIFAGVFTFGVYMKERVRNHLMKICLVVNELYAAAGVMALVMMTVGKFAV